MAHMPKPHEPNTPPKLWQECHPAHHGDKVVRDSCKPRSWCNGCPARYNSFTKQFGGPINN